MKKLVFLLPIISFIIAGCKEPRALPYAEREVVIFFSSRSLTNSLLKATEAEENKIARAIIFGYDGQNLSKLKDIENPSPGGEKLLVPGKISIFYAIVNPSDGLALANPQSISALKALTEDFAEAPQPSFLMSGTAVSESFNVNIELTRAIAKISITGENDFVINSVKVVNTPAEGYVFSQGSESLSVPDGGTTEYEITGDNPEFYVAENVSDAGKATKFVVTGETLDRGTATYTISQLTLKGTPVNIVRNNWYKISISPITEYEYDITFTVEPWTSVEIDGHIIPDENFEE